MAKIKIGIIGGTGMDDPALMQHRTEKCVHTPFGQPSDALICGVIGGVECVILGRHGRKHTLSPTNVNYRANLYALKKEGCTHVLASTACGSLQEDKRPGQIVLLDQFIDRTTRRQQTFYDGTQGEFTGVSHVPMAHPFCEQTRKVLLDGIRSLDLDHHPKGTLVAIEGPRFSTRAESFMFRTWGADVIGMTLVPEVVLAKELGLCYASVALVTDYDCWRDDDAEHVSVDSVLKVMKHNAINATKLFLHVIPKMAAMDWTETITQNQTEAASAVMGGQ